MPLLDIFLPDAGDHIASVTSFLAAPHTDAGLQAHDASHHQDFDFLGSIAAPPPPSARAARLATSFDFLDDAADRLNRKVDFLSEMVSDFADTEVGWHIRAFHHRHALAEAFGLGALFGGVLLFSGPQELPETPEEKAREELKARRRGDYAESKALRTPPVLPSASKTKGGPRRNAPAARAQAADAGHRDDNVDGEIFRPAPRPRPVKPRRPSMGRRAKVLTPMAPLVELDEEEEEEQDTSSGSCGEDLADADQRPETSNQTAAATAASTRTPAPAPQRPAAPFPYPYAASAAYPPAPPAAAYPGAGSGSFSSSSSSSSNRVGRWGRN